MVKKYIDPKNPPIQWDTIEDAFGKINDNFTELYLTIGGGSPVDLTNIGSSINPADSRRFDLGSPTSRWRRLYVGGGAIYVDNAAITASGSTLELPFGTKVDGVLIKNPADGSFRNIAVSGQSTIAAENLQSTLTLAGNGINIATNAATDTITFSNSGVVGISAGTGIGVSAATGAVTISNSGVVGISAGTGIGVSSATGAVTISNSGVTQLIAGSNIILSGSTGAVTITNGSPNILQNIWRFIAVAGQDSLDPISANATLNFSAGSNIVLTTNAVTNTVTISSPNVQDIVGSIFADDSTLLVDGVMGRIVGPVFADVTGSIFANDSTLLVDAESGTMRGIFIGSVFADDSSQIIDGNSRTVYGNIEATTLRTAESKIALGTSAGNVGQGSQAIAIGYQAGINSQGANTIAIGQAAGATAQGVNGIAIGSTAGAINQGLDSIAIGRDAGLDGQGTNAIAIGKSAASNNQTANSIVINASGSTLDVTAAGFFVNPVRSTANGRPLIYDTTTKELFSSNVLEFIGSRISTSDSSGITVDVQTTFNTDVLFENDISVAERLTLKGSRVINLTELQSVVAASSSFSDFQSRIAALA